MAWLKWRGTKKRGCWYAVWTEKIGDKIKKRFKALVRARPEAEGLLREIEGNIARRGLGLDQRVPLSQLRAKYLTLLAADGGAKSYVDRVEIALGHLERHYPQLMLPDVTTGLLDDYKSKRRADGVEHTTINREVGVIKSAVKKGRRWSYQINDLSDVGKVKGAEKRKGDFTEEQLVVMRERASPLFRIVILLGLYAGLRRSEILGLRWADVDYTQRRLILGDGWRTKGGKIRAMPLHPVLEKALRAWKETLPASETRVVPWDSKPAYLTSRFTYFLRKKCGIARGTIHSLRHTMVTALKRKDVDTAKAQRMVGHTTEKTTQVYTHLEVEDLRAGLETLDFEKTVAEVA